MKKIVFEPVVKERRSNGCWEWSVVSAHNV